MSIRGFHFLWIQFRSVNRKFINFPLPVPLGIFRELLECFLDLLNVACFFTGKTPESRVSSRVTIHSVKLLVIMAIKLMDSLTEGGAYDLADITTDKVRVIIKIR